MMRSVKTGMKVRMQAAVSQIWQGDWRQLQQLQLPQAQASWLLWQGSITARLKSMTGDFQLQLILEQSCQLPEFLAQRWHCSRGVVREVCLLLNQIPCVYAQSFLPDSTLKALTPLAQLGKRPLGEYIFQQSDLQRGDIEVASFDTELQLAGHSIAETIWGRRSFFAVQQHELLVQELFLPGLF